MCAQMPIMWRAGNYSNQICDGPWSDIIASGTLTGIDRAGTSAPSIETRSWAPLEAKMSVASGSSFGSVTSVVPMPMPMPSTRSISSSQQLADGRPEVTIAKLPRSNTVRKRKSKAVRPANGGVNATGFDDEEGLLILNGPAPFDIRSLFQRAKSTPMLLHRQSTSSGKSAQGDTSGKRFLRGHEELCLVMNKQSAKGSHLRKAWFMSAGLIGRDGGENVVIATKDSSMDPVHAEISVDGDDYILKDLNSTAGTYLCLSTTSRHHPQRDGYRLRQGDTVLLGFGAKLVFDELTMGPKQTLDASAAKKHSIQSKLERRLTDQLALERSASHVLRRQTSKVMNRMPSFSSHGGAKKTVRFADELDAGKTDPTVEATLPADGGTVFPIGSRYKRQVKHPSYPVYKELGPGPVRVTVTTPELPNEPTTLSLAPKSCYTIGSSPWCDIQVASDGIYAVHARIQFDGHFFVLQDLSFEENPKRKTRVLLSRATRIGRGDWLLLGKCALSVTNVYRAFRDHEPDLKEVAFKCHLLRPSKRKSRRREKYLPVAFKLAQPDTFVLGKGHMCDGQVFTATLCVEQFLMQLDRGQCSLTPRLAGINQGMYFLLGRNSIAHEAKYKDDVVRYTSKALMLVEGSVFKIGGSELEVIFVKLEDTSEAVARMEEIRESALLLKEMPWLQQITFDRHSMENVARRAQRLMLDAGDSVYDEGDPASFLFVVVSGEIELTSSQKANRRTASTTGPVCQGSGGKGTPLLGGGGLAAAAETPLLVETVGAGSYFGEVSLWASEMDYAETAKALTSCQLLVLSREDVCGYFSYYMDIIRPHLCYEAHKDLLSKLRLCAPFCGGLSYQELRVLASKGERIYYQPEDWILKNGVFTHKGKKRYGLLLLRYGTVDVVTADGQPVFRVATPAATSSAAETSDPNSAVNDLDLDRELAAVVETLDKNDGDGDGVATATATATAPTTTTLPPANARAAAVDTRQVWSIDTPILVLPDAPPPIHHSHHSHLKARTGVQCFYLDISAFAHLIKERSRTGSSSSKSFKTATPGAAAVPPPPVLRRRSTNRRSSYATQFKVRHSQVFTTALRDNSTDENDNSLENAELEDGTLTTDVCKKWRRKKRNRNLLEKTIVETQQNPDLLNALVLYVLSGANRGDIHVVRNVATIGGLISCADIELNDTYASPQQAVIEHREGRYWLYDTFSEWGTYVRLEENQTVQTFPGDVFLAGEVEFTCMGAFPERKKTSLCCIQ